MTITKKTVNGKEQITSCTLATCCLTLKEQIDQNQLTFFNEKGEELTCSVSELEEMFFHLQREGVVKYEGEVGTVEPKL